MNIAVIQNKIIDLRGHKVMLDSDLAAIYGVETKRLKEAVRRNRERFEGDDFMFQLSREEMAGLSRTQIATMNKSRGYNIKYAPFAFTELGVAMLSSVLHSKTAIEINRGIMRAFVALRQLLYHSSDRVSIVHNELQQFKQYIERVFSDYNDINEDTRMQLELMSEILAELQVQKKWENKPRNPIGFKVNRQP
jgi:hypothetical protein